MDAPSPTLGPHERSVGFGIERIGLAALRAPIAAFVLLALALTAAAIGIPQLRFDDNLQNVFNSGAAEDLAYRDLARSFSVGEAEILIVAESSSFAKEDSLEALRRIHFEMQLTEGVAAVTSVFSLRKAPRGGVPPQVLQPGLQETALGKALTEIDRHPFNLGKLLSADRRFALVSVRMTREVSTLPAQQQLVNAIRAAAESAAQGSDVKLTVTGIPLLRIEIVRRLIKDSIGLNLLGAAIVIAVGLLLFQSLRLTAIAVAPSILAAGTALGGMGLAGVNINAMTIVIPVLILVLVFSDSMHLTYVWAQHRRSGASAKDAARSALAEVGPACVLSTAITVLAFGTVAVSNTFIIIEFGLAGAGANILGLAVLLVAHPIVCLLLGGTVPPALPKRGLHALFVGISAASERAVFAAPRTIVVTGLAIVLLTGAAYLNLTPNYSIREHLPAGDPVNAALTQIDRHLNGAFSVQIPVPLPQDANALDAASLAEIRKVHEAVQEALPGAAVLSPWSFAQWLGAATPEAAANAILPVWSELPPPQRRRLLSDDGKSALVTTWIGELSATDTDRLVSNLEAKIAERGPKVQATGLVVHSARKSQGILRELGFTLIAEVVLAICLIALAFRSIAAGLLSILPNLLPLLATGAFLLVSGRGLQFASALALTIAFSIAVNETIHYLHRYRHSRAAGLTRIPAVKDGIRVVGPVMIATTVVLCAGLSATFFSSLPMTALFGFLCAFLLAVGLIADLLLLPALILELPRRWSREL